MPTRNEVGPAEYLEPDATESLRVRIRIASGILMGFAGFFTLFFAPAWWQDRFLAAVDGVYDSLPNFYSAKHLWSPLLLGGYPVAADPNARYWYPLDVLFRTIPGGFNAFVISAYVLSACFTCGYVHAVTRSRLAGIASGLIFSLSGFMIAHMDHVSMIHTAVWLPLILWSLEKLKPGYSWGWFLAGCFGLASCILAANFQIVTYTVGLVTLYVIFTGISLPGRWGYYRRYCAMVLLGVGLGAVQLAPTYELVEQTLRSKMEFDRFVSFSLPPVQLLTLMFPFLFGGFEESLYGTKYFGAMNYFELTGYAGLLPWVLAALAAVILRRQAFVKFWLAVAVVMLLLTMGEATPLARLMYHIPAYNLFRGPARHFFEITFALSVLSGVGVALLAKQAIVFRRVTQAVLTGAGILVAGLVGVGLAADWFRGKALEKGIEAVLWTPWSNPALGIPILVFMVSAVALLVWTRHPQTPWRKWVLISALVLDLGSASWFMNWRYLAPSASVAEPPLHARMYREVLNHSHQRLIPVQGSLGGLMEIPPNLSRLWGVPSAGGYGQLMLARVRRLMSMDATGNLKGFWSDPGNRALDVMAVRYVVLPDRVRSVYPKLGWIWNHVDFDLLLGAGCGTQNAGPVQIEIPPGFQPTHLGVVSHLACSAEMADGSELARVETADGLAAPRTVGRLLAGRDSAEWAYDCEGMTPPVRHSKARLFYNYRYARGKWNCTGHYYFTSLSLETSGDLKSLQIRWTARQGAMSLFKLTLYNEATGEFVPVNYIIHPQRLRHEGSFDGAEIYENLGTLPRAWLVPETRTEEPEDIRKAIRTSRLPDGDLFNPKNLALVEEAIPPVAGSFDEDAEVRIRNLEDERVELETRSRSEAFLVLSDVFYPGWKAFVDGEPVPVYRTDYVLRGVRVPAGRHKVVFEFHPASVLFGKWVTGLTACLLMGLYLFRRPRPQGPHAMRVEEAQSVAGIPSAS